MLVSIITPASIRGTEQQILLATQQTNSDENCTARHSVAYVAFGDDEVSDGTGASTSSIRTW